MHLKEPKFDEGMYSEEEERFNIYSHGLGFVMSLIGGVFLVIKGLEYEKNIYLISFLG